MRHRVERERTDNGFGPGWVVLDEHGAVVWVDATWRAAFIGACLLAIIWGSVS